MLLTPKIVDGKLSLRDEVEAISSLRDCHGRNDLAMTGDQGVLSCISNFKRLRQIELLEKTMIN